MPTTRSAVGVEKSIPGPGFRAIRFTLLAQTAQQVYNLFGIGQCHRSHRREARIQT